MKENICLEIWEGNRQAFEELIYGLPDCMTGGIIYIAKRVVNNMNFAAIDFETANHSLGSVCALGVVIVERGQIVKTVSKLVRPKELYFDPFNIMIHGITEELVEHEPEFCEIWPEIMPLLEGRTILAHNASFDMNVLREVLMQYELPCPNYEHSCTVQISRKTWPQLVNHKLNTVAGHLGINFKHHDALEDAMACAQIGIKACELHNAETIEELAESLRISVGPLGNKLPRTRSFHSFPYPNYPNPKDIVPETQDFDPCHPFFGAVFAFTGNLKSMSRREAMQGVVNCGGCCSNSVTKTTTFLVMGETDYARVKDGKSTKLRRAEQLLSDGLNLEILKEDKFLKLLTSCSNKAI